MLESGRNPTTKLTDYRHYKRFSRKTMKTLKKLNTQLVLLEIGAIECSIKIAVYESADSDK